ncbi:hypothetical protein BGX26_005002 [Mortierella sp. AD094]|nr:hypothetical protein BGX26_005002 [Mortierella sp. AD094]
MFWTLLRPHQKPHYGVYEWATVSEHSTDGVFMILEIVSTRMLMDIRHIVFALVFMLLYLLMTFVNWWINDTWVYSFLDFEAQGWTKTVLYYLGIAIGLIVIYILVWKVHDLKEYLGTKKARNPEILEAQETELKVVQIDK